MSWFILALLSPLFWGIENLLYKVSARKRHNSDLVGIIFLGAALAGCLVMQVVTRAVWTQIPLTVGICLVYSLCYLLVIQSRFEALKHVDVNFFFPVTKVGSLIILIVFALLVRHDSLTLIQGAGLLTACLTIYLLGTGSAGTDKTRRSARGILFTLLCTLSTGTAFILVSYASAAGGNSQFMVLGNLFTLILSLLMWHTRRPVVTKPPVQHQTQGLWLTGISIGLFNITGGFLYLEAIRLGNFSLVNGLNNLALLVTIACTLILPAYREPFGRRKIAGTVLAFLSIFLMR